MSLVLVLALITSSCTVKRTTTTSTTDTDRITALESKVNQLQSKIASLPEPAPSQNYDADIDALYDEIDSIREELDNTLIEVQEILAAWEEERQVEQEEKEAVANVKWSWDISSSNYSEADVTIDYWQTPSRMDSEGDYTIRVTLKNKYDKEKDGILDPIDDLILDITYTPNGTVYVDDKNTFLDTINKPYTLWDTEVITKGTDKQCRRISNMSEKIKLGAGEELQLKLEFVLTYK